MLHQDCLYPTFKYDPYFFIKKIKKLLQLCHVIHCSFKETVCLYKKYIVYLKEKNKNKWKIKWWKCAELEKKRDLQKSNGSDYPKIRYWWNTLHCDLTACVLHTALRPYPKLSYIWSRCKENNRENNKGKNKR